MNNDEKTRQLIDIDGTYLGSCNSVDELRETEPEEVSQFIYVISYTADSGYGGGLFVYDADDTSSVDDGGYCFVTTNGARWKRVISDVSNLTVVDFGAIPGGIEDCSDAMYKMLLWAISENPKIGIQFPAGTFYISTLEYTTYLGYFRIAGVPSAYGYFPATKLILAANTAESLQGIPARNDERHHHHDHHHDHHRPRPNDYSSDDFVEDPVILVNARRVEIANLEIYGQSDTVTGTTKGFYKNQCTAGQYLRVTGILSTYMGGRMFSVIDTLDVKFDQFYASHFTASFIYETWSDSEAGAWDHSTAIELANFNMQYGTEQPIFDLQRCTQSLINNGWIEHSEYPGDLSNGQWVINALSIESTTEPLNLTNTRTIISQLNLQGTSTINLSDPDTESWLSRYELGHTRIEAFGIQTSGVSSSAVVSGYYKIRNMTGTAQWMYLGVIYLPNTAATAKITISGTLQYNSVTATTTARSSRHGGGETVIRIQNKDSVDKLNTSWYGIDSSPINDVKVAYVYKNTIYIYVQIDTYVGDCNVLVESSDKTRFDAGTCTYFDFGGTTMTAAEVAAVEGIRDAYAHVSLSAGSYGVHIDGEVGVLALTLPAISDNNLPITVNDVQKYIQLTDEPQ